MTTHPRTLKLLSASFVALLLAGPGLLPTANADVPCISTVTLPPAEPLHPWAGNANKTMWLDLAANGTAFASGTPNVSTVLHLRNVPTEPGVGLFLLDPAGRVVANTTIIVQTNATTAILKREAIFQPTDLRLAGSWFVLNEQKSIVSTFATWNWQATIGASPPTPYCNINMPLGGGGGANGQGGSSGGTYYGDQSGGSNNCYAPYVYRSSDSMDNPSADTSGATQAITFGKYEEQQHAYAQDSCASNSPEMFNDANAWAQSWNIYGRTQVSSSATYMFPIGFGDKGSHFDGHGEGTYASTQYARDYYTAYSQVCVAGKNGQQTQLINQPTRNGASSDSQPDAMTLAIQDLAGYALGWFHIPDFTNLLNDQSRYSINYQDRNCAGTHGARITYDSYDQTQDSSDPNAAGYTYGALFSMGWNNQGQWNAQAVGSTLADMTVSSVAADGTFHSSTSDPGWINGIISWPEDVRQ